MNSPLMRQENILRRVIVISYRRTIMPHGKVRKSVAVYRKPTCERIRARQLKVNIVRHNKQVCVCTVRMPLLLESRKLPIAHVFPIEEESSTQPWQNPCELILCFALVGGFHCSILIGCAFDVTFESIALFIDWQTS